MRSPEPRGQGNAFFWPISMRSGGGKPLESTTSLTALPEEVGGQQVKMLAYKWKWRRFDCTSYHRRLLARIRSM